MAGAVMNPVQVNRSAEMSTVQTLSPSHANFFRIYATVDRLLAIVRGGSVNDINEFCRLCISLSRGIDHAVGNNEIPDKAPELSNKLKQVCQWENGNSVLAATMVLMISIKGACIKGWFNKNDNEELIKLCNEIATSFSSGGDLNSEESSFNNIISAVMLRFYPGMKMGEILAFVEATAGYGAFLKDFQITKDRKSSDDKIYLFVAQTDNIETSSCIISPQQANFLLNGKPVDMRTCLYKDPGPQLPTLVTNLVQCGTNLLQVVGQFSGKYIIFIACMSMISNPSSPDLLDYVPPVAAASDLDNDIIEGASRISLNCPISFKRIKTPVKGNLCKHLQCFDFENYVDINSRRPSWRCPHCSQSVCFPDIRIDQTMVKVLKEVGVNESHVKILADGSWEIFNECDDNHTDEPPPLQQESSTSKDMGAVTLDLTGPDNHMDTSNSNSHQENDKKPSLAQLQNVNMNNIHTSMMTPVNVTSHGQSQPFASNNMQLPTHAVATSGSNVTLMAPVTDSVMNAISQSQSQSQLSASNNMQLPTHAIGTSNTRPNLTPVTDSVMNAISQSQSQSFAANDIQLQQNNRNNMSNGYGERYQTAGRWVTRIPIGVQALPAQQTPAGMASGDRHQHMTRSQMDIQQMMHLFSGQQSQNGVHEDQLRAYSQLVQRFGGQPNGYQHQSFNQMQQPNPMWSHAGPTNGVATNQQAHHVHCSTSHKH